MKNLYIVNGYKFDESLSLDSSFISEVSGHKCQSERGTFLVDEEAYNDLIQTNKRNFDYNLYSVLTEDSKEDEANEYMTNNHKDIDSEAYDFIQEIEDGSIDSIVEFLEDELLEDIEVIDNTIHFTNLNKEYVINL